MHDMMAQPELLVGPIRARADRAPEPNPTREGGPGLGTRLGLASGEWDVPKFKFF